MTLNYYEATKNKYGFMLTQVDTLGDKFLKNLKENTTQHESIDIGSAFGLLPLEAYKAKTPVIVNDLSDEHLNIFKKRAQKEGIKKVKTLTGDFFNLDIPENSIFSIHISRVLHFYPGPEIIRALNIFYKWLIPGGQVFLINETPYFGTCKEFIPVFLERKKREHTWPGELSTFDYFEKTKRPFVDHFVHLMDKYELKKCIAHTNFEIVETDYVNRDGYFPKEALFDGRESLFAILRKPISNMDEY